MSGASGATGSTGTTGTSGASGASGATGATGASGASGATGSTGSTGSSGTSGATGATGAAGGIASTNAEWLDLITNRSPSTNVNGVDQIPQCFPDLSGQIYLRGRVNLFPVPSFGGSVLGLLPKDANGTCACTPVGDVVVTSTAIAYPRDSSVPDVCIVRVLISPRVLFDVNLDGIVDSVDRGLIAARILAGGPCPVNATTGLVECGRTDVNNDGKVDFLDIVGFGQGLMLGKKIGGRVRRFLFCFLKFFSKARTFLVVLCTRPCFLVDLRARPR